VKRYNVPLPNQGKYTRRDYIDAIRDDQRQFKNLTSKNYHALLEIAQRNNLNIRGTGARGRILRKDLIGTIKEYTSPEAFREADFSLIRRFQGNYRNWELLPRLFNHDPQQFYIANEQAIETKVTSELTELNNMKLETAMKIKFYKEKIEDGEIVRVTAEFTFKSKNTAVLNPSQVKQALKEQQEYILEKIEEFINMGSDWHVEKINVLYQRSEI
jgi:hypothetical protein